MHNVKENDVRAQFILSFNYMKNPRLTIYACNLNPQPSSRIQLPSVKSSLTDVTRFCNSIYHYKTRSDSVFKYAVVWDANTNVAVTMVPECTENSQFYFTKTTHPVLSTLVPIQVAL
jgi:hypothetical protein